MVLTSSTTVWLRSSVVSVLFSLISERSLRRPIVINLIFASREKPSVLAHGFTHSVPGITLPPGDANLCFHYFPSWSWSVKKTVKRVRLDGEGQSR